MALAKTNVATPFDNDTFWVPNLSDATNVHFENTKSSTGSPLLGEQTIVYQKLVFDYNGQHYSYLGDWTVTIDRGLVTGSVSASGTYKTVNVDSGNQQVQSYSNSAGIDVDLGARSNVPLLNIVGLVLDLLINSPTPGAGSYANLNTDATPNLPAIAYSGHDTITGSIGADILHGYDGNDKLIGGDGADILVGGRGKDVMTGGFGPDTFVYNAANESIAGSGRDVITDFANSDKMDLGAIDANTSIAGNQDFIFDGLGSADRHVGQGHVKYYYYGSNTYIVGNTGSGPDGNFQVELTGHHILSDTQFIL